MARTTRPRPPLVALFHQRLEVGDGRLHRFSALKNEGQLHLAAGEEVADDAHAVEQDLVDDVEGLGAVGHRRVQIVFESRRGRRQ